MHSSETLDVEQVRARVASIPHWYHRIEVRKGIVTPGSNDTQPLFELLNLPPDCSNVSALDVGTRDGYFAFELERRGARVLPIDYAPDGATGFRVAACGASAGERCSWRRQSWTRRGFSCPTDD